MRKYLLELGIENVRVTGSGREAVELARSKKANVDLQLDAPGGHDRGRNWPGALRDDPDCAGVGFVLASSESDGGEASKALEGPLYGALAEAIRLEAAGSIARSGHRKGRRGDSLLARRQRPDSRRPSQSRR